MEEERKHAAHSRVVKLVDAIVAQLSERNRRRLVLECDGDRNMTMCTRRPRHVAQLARLLRLADVVMSLSKHESRTQRDVYYQDTHVFPTPATLESSVRSFEKITGLDRRALGIRPTCRGLAYGSLVTEMQDLGINPMAATISNVNLLTASVLPELVIVIEKEAVFQTAVPHHAEIEQRLGKRVLLVTGRGYPCTQTRQFVALLSMSAHVLIFTDYNPWGLDIARVYWEAVPKKETVFRGGLTRQQADLAGTRHAGERVAQHSALSARACALLVKLCRYEMWPDLAKAAQDMAAAGYAAELEAAYGTDAAELVNLLCAVQL